jgi:predicted membrane protein
MEIIKSIEIMHYNVTYVLTIILISTPRKLEVVKADVYLVGISHTVINLWLIGRFTAVCIRVLQFPVLFVLRTGQY